MRHMFEENVSHLQLSTISHDNCNEANSQILLAVKSNLASSINFSRMVPTLPTMTMTNSNKEVSCVRISLTVFCIKILILQAADRRIADVSYEVENISDTENDVEPSSDVENFIEPRFYNFDEDVMT